MRMLSACAFLSPSLTWLASMTPWATRISPSFLRLLAMDKRIPLGRAVMPGVIEMHYSVIRGRAGVKLAIIPLVNNE